MPENNIIWTLVGILLIVAIIVWLLLETGAVR